MTIFMIEVGTLDNDRYMKWAVYPDFGYFTERKDAEAKIDRLTDRTAEYKKYVASRYRVTPADTERYESYLAQKAAIEAAGLTSTIPVVREPKDAVAVSYEKWLAGQPADTRYDVYEVEPGKAA
ncbi:hypothetical protein [Leifsonia sp. Leaf264]|uniref:hypothetical protein n=1 Tax=Leifsonia sp. Leaf264 TaxID=1736314 RepID=UPI0006F6CFA6|nr:hypothetical protein [Leifsonia sp. Leaf264]KQO98611.1 hypothetical protein ASF30_11150 [Leifsonia sp. Leaf264]